MTSIDKLYGLVLSGGKSTRMGTDKGLIAYHGIPQRDYIYKLLEEVCDATFLSIREDQAAAIPENFQIITDENEFKGPFNGILSAHRKYPKVAWLVLACDLPLIDVKALKELIQARDVTKLATSFALKENPLPEPLCALWEAEGLKAAVDYMNSGQGSCPRKFLIRNDVALVFPSDEKVLLNANSVSEYEEALKIVAK
ncbi:molybdenum cofactor guanylyltransferase [Cellulophaga baltica]|jgi:molybdopterin-guanine dinucleotide biosynthesis protein A|uniref:Probable molybdenum cofactor guanylyltransferase n=1 Tax=Cellulophaga baltica 18 TaxID=1348584 RepID=A0AAU8RHI5_9FLAO|nr:NTP transferase domain-containing protein [Cellulophaga baltica]AIZ42055.1 molybdenum cofactor biosynthesis protein [Cellulophaga baltica 18]